MHLKQKGYRFGVLLIYTITTITLPSVGWCEPNLYNPYATLHNDRNSVLTTKGLLSRPSNRQRSKLLYLDPRQGEGSRNLPFHHNSENRDGAHTGTSGGMPEHTLKPRMATTSTDKSFQDRNKPKQTEGGWMYTPLNPPNEDCIKGEVKHVAHGRFYITGQLEALIPNMGYRSDSAVSVQAQGGQKRVRGQRLSSSEESWQRLQPAVECGDEAMTLTVKRRRAVPLHLDRVNESSVPLSQLPPQCGYSVQTTWRDLSLMAKYDACHVTRENDSYVLPLLWRGTPIKMSCPVFQIQPEAVGLSAFCCSPYGMTVRVQGLSAAEELRVNVRGQWTPLVVLAEQCGYTLERQDAEIVIAAPFITCGITVKDGKHTLSLQIAEKTFTLACPVSPPEELPLTHQPLFNTPHVTGGSSDYMGPYPLAPPFYLAPPYYPHPTYHPKYPSPDGNDKYNPPLSLSSTTFGPQPLPLVVSQPGYQDYYSHQIPVRKSYKHFGFHSSLSSTDDLEDSSQLYPDLLQTQETTHSPSSDAGFSVQVEAPPLHAFNQYYHYYHHPKIPLPGPPQDVDPGPEVPREVSLTNPRNPEFPAHPPTFQQSQVLSRVNSDQFSHPSSLPTSPGFVHKASAPHTPYPPQPYPHHYFYNFPYIARGEAKRLAPLNPGTAAKSNLFDYQNSESSTFVRPLPHSSEIPDKYNINPYTDQPNSDTMINSQKNIPEWIKHPLLSDDGVKAVLDDKKRRSAVQPLLPPGYRPGPDTVVVLPPEQPPPMTPSPSHHLPPYPYSYYPYYYYYQMYYGQSGTENPVSPTYSKEALDPLLQASLSPLQHPSYRKHQTTPPPTKPMYDVHSAPLHPYYYYHLYYQPEGSVDNQELHPAGTDYSMMEWLVHAAEAGYPSIPQQHPYDPFGHPDEEEAEERPDEEIQDHLKANLHTPSASPCGLGFVSDFDCSMSLGCCSYPVKDCTMGQHFIFAVPDSVLKPTVTPPGHPTEVFGQTVVHLLEVHGIHSLQQDHSSVQDNSPVRLMVECCSSLGSPGEVRLHVMDQPPPPPVQSTPAIVTVQLRIATDESFTSFHPEAHLPLGLMRGKPVYVEVSLLDPPEPGLVLLVHSCLAYTQAPYTSWMLVYDGCPSRGDSQQLPSRRSHSHHIRRIIISSFLSLPSESPSYMAKGGYYDLEDPEIYFLCMTEVCSAADGDCTVGCINSKFNTVETKEKLRRDPVVYQKANEKTSGLQT